MNRFNDKIICQQKFEQITHLIFLVKYILCKVIDILGYSHKTLPLKSIENSDT